MHLAKEGKGRRYSIAIDLELFHIKIIAQKEGGIHIQRTPGKKDPGVVQTRQTTQTGSVECIT